MAQDPRKFLADECGFAFPNPRASLRQTERSAFFEGLGKAGDLEVLNNVNNDIGQGLRSLETVANQIRTGLGVPDIWNSNFESSLDSKADAVLDAVGIDPGKARTVVANFNPQVVNRAVGQAERIAERVQQGNFEIRDVPEALQDFGNLGQLARGVFTPPGDTQASQNDALPCDPSPYARDLIALAPKHKFMFIVEFGFQDPHQSDYKDLDFAFVIKRTTRPQIQFDYEEVNFYNFRTKVLKRLEYQQMTMTFYDDIRSNVLSFYNNYLRAISPLSRIETVDSPSVLYEESGMTFTPDGDPAVNAASTRNVDRGVPGVKTILDYIRIYHLAESGKYTDLYQFDNPKITDMQLDDLDMTDSGAGTEMTITFAFDALAIEPRIDTREFMPKLTQLTDGGLFAIDPKFDGSEPPSSGVTSTAGRQANQLGLQVSNVARQATQAGQNIVRDAIAANPQLNNPPTIPSPTGG